MRFIVELNGRTFCRLRWVRKRYRNVKVEPGAVVCRVAQTFVRFGTFQLPASRGDMKLLKEIADFTVRDSFPEFASVTDDFDAEENRCGLLPDLRGRGVNCRVFVVLGRVWFSTSSLFVYAARKSTMH